MKVVPKYFEHENRWASLLEQHHGEPIPIQTVYWWIQGKRRPGVKSGKQKHGQKLVKCPLFGPLTAYLLAADLSYTGKVAKPTTAEVAEMIRIIQRGSWKALLALGQITDDASAEETGIALKRVYDAVWDG
ncbi:hypothetical protein L227DRAFT_616028 [Lentinus tigrinus ALCF2SS1-6]|uniref:Uncharacterized protein n=1 Tax=Lentinus tigrinus ALCF2SS1-6 TaxID=1328759 RepID=A0A5C2RSR7_9APHY|nr:hypothetical protein L227DRAFT_616028 [Lentinus tigrinus ALCF2SS1-6]